MDFLVSLQIKTKIYTMKVSLLKMSRNKEVINRLELQQLADMIRKGPFENQVYNLRLNYQFLKPQRQPSGQIVVDNQQRVDDHAASQCRQHNMAFYCVQLQIVFG